MPETNIDSRRNFLRKGVAMAGGAALTGAALGNSAKAEPLPIPEWNKKLGRNVVDVPYGVPSKFEKHVVRRNVEWLTPDRTASISFTPVQDLHGIITPNGLHFERFHGGCPDIDPETHRLVVHGPGIKKPMIFTVDDLKRFPSVTKTFFVECPANGGMEWKGVQMDSLQFTHGMLSNSMWTGVLLKDVLEYCGVDRENFNWLLPEGGDASGMTRSVPLSRDSKDQYGIKVYGGKNQVGEKTNIDGDWIYENAMIAWAQNGEAIRPEQGYPLRFMIPGSEGNINVKWLRRIKVDNHPWNHREENSKYTELMTNLDDAKRAELMNGKARQFTIFQESNSVITFPCPDKGLKEHGFYEMRGIAWSGMGKIKKVEVSLDGGRTWTKAQLQEPVFANSVTRFVFPIEWKGEEMLISSRSTDDTGYTQPSLIELKAARGVDSIYHKNSQQVWKVAANGEVSNVQIVKKVKTDEA